MRLLALLLNIVSVEDPVRWTANENGFSVYVNSRLEAPFPDGKLGVGSTDSGTS